MNKTAPEEAIRIIGELGGTTAVSKLCRIAPPSVANWKKKGLPRAREDFFRALRPDLFKTDKQNKQDH